MSWLSQVSSNPYLFTVWAWLRLTLSTPSAWLSVLSIVVIWQALSHHRSLLGILVLPIWIAVAFLPIGDWALQPLESPYPQPIDLPKDIDGIIVLGGAEKALLSAEHKAPVIEGSAGRILTAATLALRYPQARIIFTGGHSPLTTTGNLTEADVAGKIFANLGITGPRVMYESRSTNTHENAEYSMAIARPLKGERWILVTSAWHMKRALMAFQGHGWVVAPYPTDWESDPYNFRPLLDFAVNMTKLDKAAHEYIGLLIYSIHGYGQTAHPIK